MPDLQARLAVLRHLGDPYPEYDSKQLAEEFAELTEMDALIAYLQVLGIDNRDPASAPQTPRKDGEAS